MRGSQHFHYTPHFLKFFIPLSWSLTKNFMVLKYSQLFLSAQLLPVIISLQQYCSSCIHHFNVIRCFGKILKSKESISPSNFDGKQPNILVECFYLIYLVIDGYFSWFFVCGALRLLLCICYLTPSVRGVSHFLVWWGTNSYGYRWVGP